MSSTPLPSDTPSLLFSEVQSGADTPATPFEFVEPFSSLKDGYSARLIKGVEQLKVLEDLPTQSDAVEEEVSSLDASSITSPEHDTHVPISHLDLPQLYSRPSATVLLRSLALFSRTSGLTNFTVPEGESESDIEDEGTTREYDAQDSFIANATISAVPGSGFFTWLTQVVGSPLGWIDDEGKKEEIWETASTLMAERCGRTAAPTIKRRIRIKGMREVLEKMQKVEKLGSSADKSNDKQLEEVEDDADIFLVEPSLTEDLLGLKTWGSSFILASRLVRELEIPNVTRTLPLTVPPLQFHNPVLELGTGTGLVGIAAARLGLNVTVTDLEAILPNLEANVSLNKLPGDQISSEVLDWTDAEKDGFLASHGSQSFETIMISDPIYSIDHPPMIRNMIDTFLSRSKNAQLCLQVPLRPKFEDVRDMLYDLLVGLNLERLRYEEESGYDDFGKMKFTWSLWKWKEGPLQ